MTRTSKHLPFQVTFSFARLAGSMSFIFTRFRNVRDSCASCQLKRFAEAVQQMRIYFTIGEPTGPDDDGVDFLDLDDAFRAAASSVLRLASEKLDDSGDVRLNVYTDEGFAGFVMSSLRIHKTGSLRDR